MLNLSFSFKQNLVHLFWAACKCIFNFFTLGFQVSHAYSKQGWIIALHRNLRKGALMNLFCSYRNLNIKLILFIAWMAMDSLAKVFSKMQPKYMTLECFFVLMSLYWTSSAFEFLISCLLPNKIDFVLSSTKWILNLLSRN